MIHMMQRRAEAELIDAVGIYFHFGTPGLGPLLRVHKEPEWADRAAWGVQHRDRALRGMKLFDGFLKSAPYVAGGCFSMADITVFCGLMFANAASIGVPEDYAALLAWRSKVAELPSVKHRSGQDFRPEDLRRLGF